MESLKEFNPLMVLRYSRTHKQEHNKIYRLDALDAYNQKLVKKIAVRGISVKGLAGTNALPVSRIDSDLHNKPPVARVEMEIRQTNGIKRVLRKVGKGDNLHDMSGGLDQYKGFVVADINAIDNTRELHQRRGASGRGGHRRRERSRPAPAFRSVRPSRPTSKRSRSSFARASRCSRSSSSTKWPSTGTTTSRRGQPGEYAQIFEEEYNRQLNEVLTWRTRPTTDI